VADHHTDFATLAARGVDAMIVTGANVADPVLPAQVFWQPLLAVLEWSAANVRSTLCSCLATHAVLEWRHGQRRRRLPRKLWGVYDHAVAAPDHPLVRGLTAPVPVPHSRHNDVSAAQFAAAGLTVLLAGERCGVHLAAGEGLVLFQGHPEYDDVSLLKEYRRETVRWATGERGDYPPLLDGTLDDAGEALCRGHERALGTARTAAAPLPEFPEDALLPHVRGAWHAAAATVVGRWVAGLREDS
jgi:homoserine O-succinyltransferase